ncbi:dynamin family protein-like protein [Lojkania enalia]|uniref:Dynamin family protein-like protein n=1 Tax=Lojkania enalia TaxID=147567 RepID=A0A9P4JZ63_9PLEO|nr:dynamin family protein-like protein [Didymosphaeria enalia]
MSTETFSSETNWDGVSMSPDTNAVDLDAVTTDSLKALQSDKQRTVLDIVDKLRRMGLQGVVALPQIVVCGDQSSGKSSVLEAITEIPFPRKENLCTRFATEIILRRSSESSITITINPDKNRPKNEQMHLKGFDKTIQDFKELPDIVEEATQVMGLGRVGDINSRAFSRDVLSLEICGPNRPQLTLVDLPGLTHSANKSQTEADKELVLDMVKQYMKDPRTIILGVLSAKNDLNNQIILDHVRKIEGASSRTLGIITKPDFLREGSENELGWIEVAQNKDVYLERGWHILKNRADNEMNFSFDERNQSESLFFSKGRYAELSREQVGVESLRKRLSDLLLNHLLKELPSLKEELNTRLQEALRDIENLGEKRSTISEQRMMLIKISLHINDILKSAVKGHYDHPFFGAMNLQASVISSENIRRFRAVIQHLNTEFAENMRLRGHKYAIGPGPGDEELDVADEQQALKEPSNLVEDDSLLPIPKVLTRPNAISWVQRVLERSRGLELSGNPNSSLISQIFWEQSEPWEEIALDHINKVARLCKALVYIVLEHAAPPEFLGRLAGMSVDAALTNALSGSKEELRKILKDKTRHPMTYNHYFTTTLQKQRQRKRQKVVKRVKEEAQYCSELEGRELLEYDAGILEKTMVNAIEQNMYKFSSEEALDVECAYYKEEMKYFLNLITKQCIERHLVEPLPDIILSPVIVTQLNDKEIEFIAAEPPEITQQRTFLESRKAILEKGLDTFREAMGGLKR